MHGYYSKEIFRELYMTIVFEVYNVPASLLCKMSITNKLAVFIKKTVAYEKSLHSAQVRRGLLHNKNYLGETQAA